MKIDIVSLTFIKKKLIKLKANVNKKGGIELTKFFLSILIHASTTVFLSLLAMSNTISWNQSKFAAMLEKDVTSCL